MNPKDRNAVIRECIAALPLDGQEDTPNTPVWLRQANAIRRLEALLSPIDQGEASEPLQSARADEAPADHGPGADAQGEAGTEWLRKPLHRDNTRFAFLYPEGGGEKVGDPNLSDWTPDERTVSHVADMVEAWSRNGLSEETNIILAVADDIRGTLPKQPDRAEELVRAWEATGATMTRDAREGAEFFARWLLSRGEIK
ncbi:hypothetical protein M2336_001681 [Sphingobium sp. B1D7B]|uniref:hypothetical protein n=1 Tax=Sphingobium sp. B1D7B TaxID=2940578 RepID=UPI002224FD84|nr:hypothetical protein [Sphingobium sp. B1D7B]MCW2405052.1 hypothetical protein [Sphingobium sp. B1D7B]